MIPRLHNVPKLSELAYQYIKELSNSFEGDVTSAYSDRLSLATDNSVYQQIPQAILFPKNINDVVIATQLANEPKYYSLTFTARGAGTGTNGQAVNNNIIIDFSRYMTNILELNLKERWVRVETGVVKDQLNQYLKPYGLFFSPELSTSNRATLGGMINTDASGQGSLQYGKTSDHVLALRSVLIAGEILETHAISSSDLDLSFDLDSTLSANNQNSNNNLYLQQEVYRCCKDKRPQIVNNLPKLNRFITGYDLKNVFNHDLSKFNLSRILTGSEGSLALVCEAKLNLLPIPKFRVLVNIKYRSFNAALTSAPLMLKANALSVETIDSKVLNLAKKDIIWHSVKELLVEQTDNPILGLNIVEFAGDDEAQLNASVSLLTQQLDHIINSNLDDMIGYQVCKDSFSIEQIYAMRKKAVGLLGNVEGWKKPIAFVEDSCVPPEHLADYISEFRAILDENNLEYGMFGHVDAGVLHVRPALDLTDPTQVTLFKQISDKVADLTLKYGGLIWGEHGKGMRSQYGEKFFTTELWQTLRYIKQLFDPNNRLNPGKICTPLTSEQPLYSILSPMRADYDKQIPIRLRDEFEGAMNCNGNGLCFNYDVDSAMCPSMKISRNRVYSPKGRAALIREWLRLLSENRNQSFITKNQVINTTTKLLHFFPKLINSIKKWCGQYDFSHEVKMAMDTCLACKACNSQCPIKIDVPKFRTLFLDAYYSRYLRSIKDHIIANVEILAPILAKKPKLANIFSASHLFSMLMKRIAGITDLPLLSIPSLQQQLIQINYQHYSLAQLDQLSKQERKPFIAIAQDPFTSYYDANVVADFIKLVQKLGFKPVLLSFKANGKALHVKGFVARFTKTARKQAKLLNHVANLQLPIIGVDPAIVLSYRDEYKQILQPSENNFHVLTAQEWLFAQLIENSAQNPVISAIKATANQLPSKHWHLFLHCTEGTMMPASKKSWQLIFEKFGQKLTVENVGCCGMAGTFGHETEHLAMSKQIYDLSWAKKLKNKELNFCLASGYSCRSQTKRFEQQALKHPIQALLSIINGNL